MKIIFTMLLILKSLFAFDVQKPTIYSTENIKGWLMSEKLDGIRGYWDGKNLYTKNGNPIIAPKYFLKNFPPFPLDGELWSKRDDFEFIQSTVLDSTPSINWKKITYHIFEVPNANGTFIKRLEKAKKWFNQNPNSQVMVIDQIVCENEVHLQSFLQEITNKKGEGVIVKDPLKSYHTGRSLSVLKVKNFADMEGKVIGYNYREDETTIKSLIVQLDNKVTFNLGSGFSQTQRLNPPKINDIITFKYYGFTKIGKPKFASFLRVRVKE